MEAEALTDWLYQRFVEKEELLAHFYDTGLSHPVVLIFDSCLRKYITEVPSCLYSSQKVEDC